MAQLTGVVILAAKVYFQEHEKDEAYTAEDGLVYALEEYDTGYDLTEDDYKQLIKEVEELIHG